MIELGLARAVDAAEVRSGESSYTNQVLSGSMVAERQGAGAAAVQAAAGLWARCLSVAKSELEQLTPDLLGAIGFDLGVVGEFVGVVQVDGTGRVSLLRAASWNIAGGPDPRSWIYQLTLSGPTSTHTRVLPADSVVHVRYLPDNRTPWRGVAPWRRAPNLSKLAAEVEAALIREVRLPTKIIIPMPQGANIDTNTLRSQFQNSEFQIAFPTTTSAGFGGGRSSAPLTDWKTTRLKSEPDEGLVGLCRDIPGQVGVLYGIPVVMSAGTGSESIVREAFRRFVLTTIEPIALIVSRELTRVFEVPVELDLSDLAHADIAGRARAFKALVGSGMTAADAAEFAKIEV